MKKMNAFGWVVFLLVVTGALNWGLVGIFKYDLVASLFGAGSMISRAIYGLVGIAGIVKIVNATK